MRALALAAALLTTTPAFAASVDFTGDTTGDPTWNRPLTTTTLSGVGTDVPYEAVGFTVDVSGEYTLDLASFDLNLYDPFLVLYADAFDASAPLDNILATDDDSGPVGANSQIIFSLLAGTSYFAVATGFANDDFGAYTLTIDGPGTASNLPTGPGVVPEPATWAMMLAGFGIVGHAMRRRKATVRYAQAA